MTPKELYELAKEHGCENEELILYDGETPWILEESLLAIWENDKGNKAVCIKQV